MSTTSSSSALSLSVRTPDQILALSFSPADNFLGEGVVAKKQTAALLGPGGVGKSRLTMQVAYATILGCDFLGLSVNCSGKKWLFLQTENSNRRLRQDLEKHRTAFSKDEWDCINTHLHLHTLEHELDERLHLSDSNNANAIARLVKDIRPDIVVVDPLNAFAKGSLNCDEGMLATLHELTRLARMGNPDATVLIVQHTLTGKDGFKKAVGPDRASYGRGSKSLHGYVRGSINVAPGDHDDTRKIMIACGKNSNGAEFEPFGAILNTETMLYERDPSFNLENWRRIVCGEGGGRVAITPAQVAQYVEDRALKKVDLVAEIMKETGCQKTKAYEAIALAENSTIIKTPLREYRAIKI
jgi:hypothetical protein